MLKHLTIRNYALIRRLEIEPSAHLNVITGETGAGKSIMLGAIGLLLGERADTKVLWNEEEKCVVEGTFDVSTYDLQYLFENENLDFEKLTVVRREINPGGKSRAFINDTPVTLDVMKRIGHRLIDIHSQHETLELSSHLFQLELVDAYAGNSSVLHAYQNTWRQYTKCKSVYDELMVESVSLKQEADFINYQLNELVKANLSEGEQEQLEAALKVLEHAEEIKGKLTQIAQLLNESEWAVINRLADVRATLQSLSDYGKSFENLFHRMDSLRIEAQDIFYEIEKEEAKIEYDPSRNEEIKERLSTIYQLQQKHKKSTVGELLMLQADLQERALKTENLDEALTAAKSDVEKALHEVDRQSLLLSTARRKIFKPLTSQMVGLLQELGMPDAQVNIAHEKIPPGKTGTDRIEVLFSANKGIAPRPLSEVASGGEFSRLMFAVKFIMAEKTSMPTLILDEIDTGVSGEIAMRLGRLMKSMAQRHQLIAISHLPQIAAKANVHYFVYKNNTLTKTVSEMRALSEDERVEEIAKMIGGNQPSAKARDNARELMGG
jgi:DNA repair protein RecN (Recombination protein N)